MMRVLFLKLFALCLCKSVHTSEEEREVSKDYCQKEIFNPRCAEGNVILMKSAIFGRMKIGKCLIVDTEEESMISNPRYLRCSSNVLSILDKRCTGKKACDVAVLDDEFQQKNPCFKGLVPYLSAHYSCVQAAFYDVCRIVASSSSPSYILSSFLKQSMCGSTERPMTVETTIGQQIKFGIVNLNTSTLVTSCPFSFGHILEETQKRSFCINNQDRYSIFFTSQSNKIEISIERESLFFQEKNLNFETFLLFIEAVGCSDPVPAEDSWMKRNNEILTVGCYSSRRSWQLRCVGNKWVGVLGNCTTKDSQYDNAIDPASSRLIVNKNSNFEILGIIVICGIGIAVCIVIIGVGYLCGKRYKSDASKVSVENENIILGSDFKFHDQNLLQQEKINDMNSTYFVLNQADT